MSSGRQKKFHRHFQQVDADERVINCMYSAKFYSKQYTIRVRVLFKFSDFSCALVSDILLQGHLYITDNYFAFYSNVFGFVTKVNDLILLYRSTMSNC